MNMFDYISWRGDIGFHQSPFNPVDNIIFAQLAYLPMEGIVPGPGAKGGISIAEAAQLAEKQRDDLVFPADDPTVNDAVSLIISMGTAPRYQNCELTGYISHIDHAQEKQFSACTVILTQKLLHKKLLVVFRGTDISLVGWKEDFNMSFNPSIPSQREAAAYLDAVAEKYAGPLMTAGHSKGGNLAIYASAYCSPAARRRITAVYSNDAPGFTRQIIESEGYQEIRPRIFAFVPQSSIVGMLFEHGETPSVIISSSSGAMQHNLCTWEVTRGDLARAGELSQRSRLVEAIIRDWINDLPIGQRRQFIDAVYKVLVATNAHTVADLSADWFKSAAGIIQSLKDIDKPTRKLIGKIISQFIKTARKNIINKSLFQN